MNRSANRGYNRARRRLAVLGAVVIGAAAMLTGCGGDDSGGEASPLRVGYQRYGSLSLLKARNEAPGVTWSLFESGPALTEALKAGSIDIGETGEAPPIFAAAGKIQFKIVATSDEVPQGEAVLVKESSGFKTFADLRGKTVALNKGSNVHWLLVKLLEANNMTLQDLTVRYLKPAEGRPAFDSGQVDAWIIWDPYFALAEQPGVKVLADATGLASNREYILAAPDAVEKKADQVRDLLTKLDTTTEWGIANPDERARVLAPELKIDEGVAKRSLARSAKPLAPVTPAIGDELQAIADGFAALKLIPEPIDIKARVDTRFTEVFT
jgi:sulfonate transport system substrate-binding protein